MKSRLPRRGSTARSGLRSTCCKRNIPVAGSSFVRSSASTRAACSPSAKAPALVLGRLPGQSLDLRLGAARHRAGQPVRCGDPFYTMAVYDRVVPNNALDRSVGPHAAAVTITVFDLVMKLLRSYLVKAPRARPTLRCPRTSSPMRFNCAPPAGHLRRGAGQRGAGLRIGSGVRLLGDPEPARRHALHALLPRRHRDDRWLDGGGAAASDPLTLGYRGGFASRSPPNSHPICRKVRSAQLTSSRS